MRCEKPLSMTKTRLQTRTKERRDRYGGNGMYKGMSERMKHKAAQNIQVLPLRLPRSDMVLSPQHPLTLWGMKPTFSWPPTCDPSRHD
jgi:hypothetical protein